MVRFHALKITIQEVEYLLDLKIITQQQYSSILEQIPAEIPVNHSPINPLPSPVPSSVGPADTAQPAIPPHNEKQPDFFAPSPAPALPPPAYAPTPSTSCLALAAALYKYEPSDAGDLALLVGDRIFITEFINADWAKGTNRRSGLEGIFPRSYVTIVEENDNDPAPSRPTRSSYGNLPLEISQSSGNTSGLGGKESNLSQNGKKFGKKLGNASQLPMLPECGYVGSSLLTFSSDFWCRGYNRLKYCQGDFLERRFGVWSLLEQCNLRIGSICIAQ